MGSFQDIRAGDFIGEYDFYVDPDLVDRWKRDYPSAADFDERMPVSLVTVVQLKALLAIVPQRPAGTVTAGQEFEIFHRPPIGATLRVTADCVSREIRSDREWVKIRFIARDDTKQVVFAGVNTLVPPK
ncbi:MAG: hypothetical protein AAAC47_14935 [Pararhizobium sp.]